MLIYIKSIIFIILFYSVERNLSFYKKNLFIIINYLAILIGVIYLIASYLFLIKLNEDYFFYFLFILFATTILVNLKNKINLKINNLDRQTYIILLVLLIYFLLSNTFPSDTDTLRYHLFIPKLILEGKFFTNYTMDYTVLSSNEFINYAGLIFNYENASSTINLVFLFLIYKFNKSYSFFKENKFNSTIKVLTLFAIPFIISNLSSQKLYIFPCILISIIYLYLFKKRKLFLEEKIVITITSIFVTTIKLNFILFILPILVYIFFSFKKVKVKFYYSFFVIFLSILFFFPILYLKFKIFSEPFVPFYTFKNLVWADEFKNYILDFQLPLSIYNLFLTPLRLIFPFSLNEIFFSFYFIPLLIFFIDKKYKKHFLKFLIIYFIIIIFHQNLQHRWFLIFFIITIFLCDFNKVSKTLKSLLLTQFLGMFLITIILVFETQLIFVNDYNSKYSKFIKDYKIIKKNQKDLIFSNTESLYYMNKVIPLGDWEFMIQHDKDYYKRLLSDKKNFKLIYMHHKKPDYKALMENIFPNIDYQIKKIVEKENVIRDGRSNYWKRRYIGKKEKNFYLEMEIKIK